MTDINCFTFIGRVTANISDNPKSFAYLNNGTAVATFFIAVNASRKNGDKWEDEANFFEIKYFGKGAESIKPYLLKGTQVCVSGSVKQEKWNYNGTNHQKIIFIADQVQLLGSKQNTAQKPTQTNMAQNNNFVPVQNAQVQVELPIQNELIPF